jgi:hypothetical protein
MFRKCGRNRSFCATREVHAIYHASLGFKARAGKNESRKPEIPESPNKERTAPDAETLRTRARGTEEGSSQ